MAFLFLFVVAAVVFPLCIDVYRNGADNIAFRASRDAETLVADLLTAAASHTSGMVAKILRPVASGMQSRVLVLKSRLTAYTAGAIFILLGFIVLNLGMKLGGAILAFLW